VIETYLDTREPTEALELAEAVAKASGVVVRELVEPSEHRSAEELLARVWKSSPGHPPVSRDLMCALAHTGGYVAGAYVGESLLAASVGMLSVEHGRSERWATAPGLALELHSHITAVDSSMRSRNVGRAMKLHQRAWALQRGIGMITWTYDPLVSRNAYFNLVKLGACGTAYLIDFYGEMDYRLSAGHGSDRLWTSWELVTAWRGAAERARQVDLEVSKLVGAGQVRLGRGPSGEPIAARPISTGEPFVCAAPVDIEAMRATDPARARSWRCAMREVLEPALAEGLQIAGYCRSGWYLITAASLPPVASANAEPWANREDADR